MEAERHKIDSERAHQEAAMAYTELEKRAMDLEKKLKKSIAKSK